jgi:aromatic ring hydroxylase
MKDAAQSLADKYKSKSRSREAGVGKAVDRLAKEEVANIQERSLSEPEMKKKEEVVKSMKKNLSGFKDRYGDDAKSVMYATATKIAKKD